MRRLLKWLWRVPLALIGLIIVVVIVGYFYLRGSVPDYDDTLRVAGIDAPVQIIRDERAVPHIYAGSERDAAFALGFVHAQDRLWQMDMQRRVGQGRVAELIGSSAVPIDRFMRTVGAYRFAEASYDRLAPELQDLLSAYSDGVNAYIDQHSGAWPPEFYALWYDFEPWQPADTLVWGRLMDIQLSANWRSELARASMDEILAEDQVDFLIPPGPGEVETLADLMPEVDFRQMLAAMPAPLGPSQASNEWAISGEHTESGLPIVANDPHLSLEAPIIWYLARIETPGLTAVGATIPGVPMVVLGHNTNVAWGLTTAYTDAQDLFVELVDPEDPTRYLTPDGSEPFETREEVIAVRFGDEERLTVRETRHGPVISDINEQAAAAVAGDSEEERLLVTETLHEPAVSDANGETAVASGDDYVMALQATGFTNEDIIAGALYDVNHATDAQSLVEALSGWITPQQNIIFGDTQGTIGFVTVGRVPLRPERTGYRPVAGWDADNDWQGYIPFADMPQQLNPESGVLINANNSAVGPDYPFFLGYDEIGDYRAMRINQLLSPEALTEPVSVEANQAFQADDLSLAAAELLPLLLEANASDTRAGEAYALLRAWDYRMDRERPEPLIYSAWVRELSRAIFSPALGELFEGYWGLHPSQIAEILRSRPEWCDDASSQSTETCEAVVQNALDQALDWLAERHGADIAAWRWGDEHIAPFRHQLFSRIPVISGLVDLSIATDGSDYTVNRAGGWIGNPTDPFLDTHGPSYRAVYDLSDLDNSLFGIAPGQSGNPFSPHYGDLREMWRDVELFPISGTPEELRETGLGTTTLRPSE
ncbi:MAG: penicillin acylase family protein [Pseudomonadota bacterium]